MHACLHTITQINLRGNTGISSDRERLQKYAVHLRAKQTCRTHMLICATSAHTPMQRATVERTHCFCPACDRESAFCLNYRAALWILSTTHILSRHCSEKQTQAHTATASRPTDISETFFSDRKQALNVNFTLLVRLFFFHHHRNYTMS